jgi:hypothetical protein
MFFSGFRSFQRTDQVALVLYGIGNIGRYTGYAQYFAIVVKERENLYGECPDSFFTVEILTKPAWEFVF